MNLSLKKNVKKTDKIVFLVRSLNTGGAERQMIALAKGLHESGHTVMVAIFYSGGALEPILREAGVPMVTLGKRKRWDVFGFLWKAIALFRNERPAFVHSYLVVPNIIATLLRPFLPGVKIVWGIRASNVDFTCYDRLSALTYKIELWLSRFPDLIIINSQVGYDYAVSKGYPAKKISVIPNGIDTEHFRPNPESGAQIRASWGIDRRLKLIGLVGRLDPMKDHRTFLSAASLVARKRDDITFVCIGDGPENYKSELLNFAKEMGLGKKLIWAGAHSDMPSVYSALDIASSSSYSEGFPNVIGEAMACGIPCVVTNAGDSALIVGDTGIVVPQKNPQALADGILALLRLLEEKGLALSVEARTRITVNFSLDKLIANTSNVIGELEK